ncbi:MAG: hypothetical protein MUO82_00970 [Candidatus Thermoplasmatota archaeon]|nr:hypothetical protein [Candidatus Thermoplasmatota archaeon]
MKQSIVQCEICKQTFKTSGNGKNMLMVLSGGLDCPECKTKNGIKIVLI